MSKLKACPFCGSELINIERDGGFLWMECTNCHATGKVHLFLSDTGNADNIVVNDWNTRPLEDELRERAEKAEAIIDGMFPMWIAAMSFAEHGRAADLDRIRNYYNGRDNPLTSEQLRALFEIQKPRNIP